MGGVVYSKRPTIYKARKGDTVLSIADDFGVPAAKVRQWNHLRGNQVLAGHSLRIYRPVAAEAAVGRTLAARRNGKSSKSSSLRASNGRKLLHHKVKKGETLVSIASRYNTSVATLRRDNRVSSLKAGDVLVIRTP